MQRLSIRRKRNPRRRVTKIASGELGPRGCWLSMPVGSLGSSEAAGNPPSSGCRRRPRSRHHWTRGDVHLRRCWWEVRRQPLALAVACPCPLNPPAWYCNQHAPQNIPSSRVLCSKRALRPREEEVEEKRRRLALGAGQRRCRPLRPREEEVGGKRRRLTLGAGQREEVGC